MPNGYYCTALHAAAYEGHAQIVEYLLKEGVRADLVDAKNITPLVLACLNNREDVVRKLLSNPNNQANVLGPGPRDHEQLVYGTRSRLAYCDITR
jgi:ankyrin repeat protein